MLSELTQTIRAAIRCRSASGICCATVASFIKPPATELTVQVALPKPSPWISQAHAGFSTACLLHNAWIKRYKLKKKKKTAAEVSNIYACTHMFKLFSQRNEATFP